MIRDKFQSEIPSVLTARMRTADNNQSALNASLDESQGPLASGVQFQNTGLLAGPSQPVTSAVALSATQTVGEALGGAGAEGAGGVPSCPTATQFVLVEGNEGAVIPKRASDLTTDDRLLNPLTGVFEKVAVAEAVHGIGVWSIVTGNGVAAEGSGSHPLIRSMEDTAGLALRKCAEGTPALSCGGKVRSTYLARIAPTGTTGTVIRIETEGPGHIYAAGTRPDRMVLWHNLKPIDGDGSEFEA